MTVRMIETYGGYARGRSYQVDPQTAKVLISGGYAVRGKETATDKRAEDALHDSRQRDNDGSNEHSG